MCRDEYGPQHLKLVAEWEPAVQSRYHIITQECISSYIAIL